MARILIIEDDPGIRANLVDILELENHDPLAAASGSEGLELACRESPDLILCDIMMPGMDGFAVLLALRQNEAVARIPFVFLTARGEQADVRVGMNLGADDYLIKPVKVDDLLGAVEARLERSRQHLGFKADFRSAKPLESLGLSQREAEILLWVAQGKTNAETSVILNVSSATVKKHLEHIYQKLGVESRNAATLRALEALSK
jgi:DNA-binding NarL/FixJ family response regulator